MQTEMLKRNFEQERQALKLRASDLETKMESFRKDLVTAESALSVRDMELASVQNNLKELEELREMKEVCFSIGFNFSRVVIPAESPLPTGLFPNPHHIFYFDAYGEKNRLFLTSFLMSSGY